MLFSSARFAVGINIKRGVFIFSYLERLKEEYIQNKIFGEGFLCGYCVMLY